MLALFLRDSCITWPRSFVFFPRNCAHEFKPFLRVLWPSHSSSCPWIKLRYFASDNAFSFSAIFGKSWNCLAPTRNTSSIVRNTSSKNVTRGFEKICVEFHRLKLIFKSKVRVIITVRERKVQTSFFFIFSLPFFLFRRIHWWSSLLRCFNYSETFFTVMHQSRYLVVT